MSAKTTLQVEGMTCSNCALTVTRHLEKQGMKGVGVNFANGEVVFDKVEVEKIPAIVKGINDLGYHALVPARQDSAHHDHSHHVNSGGQSAIEKKFFISLVFTVPLLLPMVLPLHFLHNPVIQLLLSLPVMYIGTMHFGRSAWASVKTGIPNMDVLISVGSLAAFVYSLAGMIKFYGTDHAGHYLFFETAASIITLVLLGNLLEHRSVKKTTSAIEELGRMKVVKAKRVIAASGEQFEEVDYDRIQKGDLLLVNTGDKIPVDGEIVSGNAAIDEAMISGESIPVEKGAGGKVTGGTLVVQGSIRMKAERVGDETVLAQIIDMVKSAHASKPSIQKLGDRVSAVFVPVVLVISTATFFVSHFAFEIPVYKSLMSSIAVLVISCPCAMGLATPTAVMVGIGRAAKNGILIRGGSTLEQFAGIKTIVFDKTGTLTTGEFKIMNIQCYGVDEQIVKTILHALEQHSSHPIAKSIVKELSSSMSGSSVMHLQDFKEEKGLGISARDASGTSYLAGSFQAASHLTADPNHSVYLLKNNKLIATLDVEDEIRANAKQMIAALKKSGLQTILLSGDRKEKCDSIASLLEIDKVFSEQVPEQKLNLIDEFARSGGVAMVGDGINDAPALAKATVGISLGNATQAAIQSAQVVLLKADDLMQVVRAHSLSRHTLLTIKQNLFWAFFYNVLAIPISAVGLLSPMIGALAMAFSDVMVIGNSLRLNRKKIS